ncbi:MAG: hypothetical protein R2744_07285 [Bacteroidales bacterium]
MEDLKANALRLILFIMRSCGAVRVVVRPKIITLIDPEYHDYGYQITDLLSKIDYRINKESVQVNE